jgi:N-acetylmuramoyl-L-alanine amidase
MPATHFHAGSFRLLTIAGCLWLLGAASASAAQHNSAGSRPSFEHAQKMREALEGRPERQRTRRDYERVLDAYRSVYHSNPASPRADASIFAVADLLAEEGRIFEDDKSLYDAIGQYEFLRKNYPQSRFRYTALLTTGEVYLRDLNDPQDARLTFEQFLRLYPQSSLAAEARVELRNLRRSPVSRRRSVAQNERPKPNASAPRGESAARRDSGETGGAAKETAPERKRVSQEQEPTVAKREVAPTADSESSGFSEAELNATPPPRRARLPLVTGIRHWSTPVYTRVAIDLQDEVQYEAVRVPDPDRIFFDLHDTRLSPELIGRSDQVIDDGFLKQIRAAQFSNDVTRIVLDVSDVSDYSAFFLPNPPRLIIDVHGSRPGTKPAYAAAIAKPKPEQKGENEAAAITGVGLGPEVVPTNRLGTAAQNSAAREAIAPDSGDLDEVASLSQQPNRVRATRRPTTAPVAQSVAGTSPAPQPDAVARPLAIKPRPETARKTESTAGEAHPAQFPPDEQPTLVRTLGLKINRIVVDAGHGGHDSGTLGPGGIEEKNVVLDVALRLGALLKQRLGADVIYTRDDDTFIPLETRTAIANKAQADLFISIHANSSPDPAARGVETYFLNFTTSADALEVAARENAVSDQSIHQLSDLVKKIALQDKINESREFASDVQQSLYSGLEDGNPGLKDRGVKKAPFVVLIGANMPSILAEISFLTNPDDASELRQPEYRERIAESLYRGVLRYVDSLSGVRLAEASSHSNR